jgi:hypothetical protein
MKMAGEFFFVAELHAPIDIWEKNVANREGEFWTRAERSRQLGTYLNYIEMD